MTIIVVCLIGAVLGAMAGVLCARFALPYALKSQQRSGAIDSMPGPFKDQVFLERLTRFVYRYWIPTVFAGVGAFGAYTTWLGRSAE